MLLACLIGLFGYDLLQAYRQWLEIFVEGLQGGVEIGEDEIRPEGFSRARLAGPVLLLCGDYRFGDGLATNTRYAKIMYSRAPGDGCGITCVASFLSGATKGREPGILPIKYFGAGLKESLLNWFLETSLGLGVTNILSDEEGDVSRPSAMITGSVQPEPRRPAKSSR